MTWTLCKEQTFSLSLCVFSFQVRKVLDTLVRFGAADSILKTGSPHLGTDKLVRILQAFRRYLAQNGVDIRFGTKLTGLDVHQMGGGGEDDEEEQETYARLRGVHVEPSSGGGGEQELLR